MLSFPYESKVYFECSYVEIKDKGIPISNPKVHEAVDTWVHIFQQPKTREVEWVAGNGWPESQSVT